MRQFVQSRFHARLLVSVATVLAFPLTGLAVVGASTSAAAAAPASAAQAPADVTERPDAVSAMVSARVEDHPVEDLSQRSETTKVSANPDGTWTRDEAAGPVRTQDDQGDWADIDTDLVALDDDGGYAPKNAIGDLVISSGGDKTTAAMNVKDRVLRWQWPTTLPAPVIDGNTATYTNAVAGGDLVVTATPSGFSQEIVLREAPVADVSFKVPVLTGGPKLTERTDGDLAITTAAGDDLVTAPQPVMYDSSEDAVGGPENTAPVDVTVTKNTGPNGGGTLTLSPDQEFLTDPATVYPVTVDPAFTSYALGDTWITNTDTTSHVSSDDLRVGSINAGATKSRTFMNFADVRWAGKHVEHAELRLSNFYAVSCTASSVQATRITQNWAKATVTWPGPSVSTSGADNYAPAHGFTGCPAAEASWDIGTIVQAWADGAPQSGIRLAAVSETSSNGYRRYRSTEFSPASTETPRLTVTYSSPPAAAATPTGGPARTFDGFLYVGRPKPTWTSSATDADGARVKYTIETRPSTTSGTISATCTTGLVASGATASCTPGTSLANNTSYVARSEATDEGGVVGAWSSWRAIKTDLTTPSTPSISCSNVTDGNWYETRPASSTSCDMSGNGGDMEYQVNGVTQTALPPSATTTVPVPLTGYTDIEVRSRTRAGAVSNWARVAFGTGPASLLSPNPEDRSSSTFPVEAAAPPGAASARVQWRFAPSTGGSPDPEANWTNATQVKMSNDEAWDGSVSGTDASSTPKLVWNPQAESGISSTALVELRVVFSYSGSIEKASTLERIQVVPHAFGGSFPTDSAGPGEVALYTGEFQMSQTDVRVPGYAEALTLGRSHLSMAGTPSGPSGVFGPGWLADLEGPAVGLGDVTVVDRTQQDGSFVLSSPEGESYVYRHSSGTAGAQKVGTYLGLGEAAEEQDSLTLVAVSGEPGVSHRLILREADGTETIFALTNSVWVTEKVVAPEDDSTTSYSHDGEGMVTWIFAPTPDGVACDGTDQEAGCRALHLNYTGSGSSKRLASVDLRIYDPHSGPDGSPGTGAGMTTITVAKYGYTDGKLTATWDPRVADGAGALKTVYGYGEVRGHTVVSSLQEPGLKAWTMNYDEATGRLSSVSRDQDAGVAAPPAVWTVRYDIPLSGSGLPTMTPESTGTWGQLAADAPAAGAAVFGPNRPDADDYEYATLSYWSQSGRVTNGAVFGAGAWQIDSQKYDALGNTIWELSSEDRNQALSEGNTDAETAGAADKYASLTVYNDTGSRVEETWSPTHDFLLRNGAPFTGRTVTETVYDDEPEAAGFVDGRPTEDVPDEGFGLEVREFDSATDMTAPGATGQKYDLDETRYSYAPIQDGDGDGWELGSPTGVKTNDGSGWSTTTTRFDTEGRTVETRTPQANASSGTAASSRTLQTVYYTADNASPRMDCRMKPEWVGQVCWHGAAGNPSTGAAIPATTTAAYSTLLAPTRITESSGTATRTTIAFYDTAGRPTGTSVATSGLSAQDRSLPNTATTYSTTTGFIDSISNGAQTQSATYDSWGRVVSQTDGNGNVATANFDGAGRIASLNDGKGTYTYTYDGTDSRGKRERRGLVTKLDVGLTSGPDEITGAYSDAGGLVEENYPGGITANWTRDSSGFTTALNYSQTTTQGPSQLIGFSQSADRDGRTRVAAGPVSTESYTYDDLDRLTEVRDQGSEGCVTRQYSFSKDSNRTNLQTYGPDQTSGNEGACQTISTPTSVAPVFDDADRRTGSGYTYDALGRTKSLPGDETTSTLASPGDLNIGYFANDKVATLEQTGTTNGVTANHGQDFTLDATNRISVIKNSTDGTSLEEATHHYAHSDDNPAWTETKSRADGGSPWSDSWVRNVQSIGATLGISQSSDGSATVQLANPHGDIVATAPIGGSGVASFSDTDEYGVPRIPGSSSGRYGWLGAGQRQSLGTVGGIALMGARLYNPATGIFLTRDAVEGGNSNAYAYPQDPVNAYDIDGNATCIETYHGHCHTNWATYNYNHVPTWWISSEHLYGNFGFGKYDENAADVALGIVFPYAGAVYYKIGYEVYNLFQVRWKHVSGGTYRAHYRIRVRTHIKVYARMQIYFTGKRFWARLPNRNRYHSYRFGTTKPTYYGSK